MINFEFVGKLSAITKSDKIIPYDEHRYDSGWTRRQLLFNGINGTNRHRFVISGGYFPDRKDYEIQTFAVPTKDESGNSQKSERITIPWKDRNKPENIEKVANFKKFVVDIEEYGRRPKLMHLAERIHEGEEVTDEDLKDVGLTDSSEIEEAYERSQKLHREFISEWDYAEFVNKLINNSKYKDKIFHVRGVVEMQWSDAKQQWYTNMKPQRIYLAKEGDVEKCIGSAVLFYSENAVDDGSLEEKEKYYITAYTFEYDSARKDYIPCETKIVVPLKIPRADGKEDGMDEKRSEGLIKKFTVDDDKVYEYGIEFDILNGSQKVEITEDMLTDEQKDDIALGLITMEEIQAEMGSVYGDRVTEYRYCKVMRGYTKGRKETVYTTDNLVIPPLNEKLPFDDEDEDDVEENKKSDDEDEDDLFGDDDIL